MSESTLTLHTAPRTLEGLMAETPFKLRLLLTDLGGLQTEEQKMAWHQLSNSESRANHILALLKQWDAANPGVAQPPPQPAPAMNGAHVPAPQQPQMMAQQPAVPQQMPQQMGFQAPQQNGFVAPQPVVPVPASMMGAPMGAPPAVSPQAAAQAAAATQAEPAKTSKRSPRTGGASAAPDSTTADLGAQVLQMLQTILQGLGAEAQNRMAWQKQITDMLEEAASSKASRVTALEQKYNEVAQALHHLSAAQQTQQQLQIWTLMAFLTLAEGQTGGSIVAILKSAISDSAMFQKIVDQATGKA